MLYSAEIEPFTRRRPERRAPAGNKYRAVEVSGGVEKERDYFGRRDDRYDDRRDRGYDRRGYDDRDRASCGVPGFLPVLFPAQASSATARATATTTAAAGTTTTAATAGATTTTAATTAARHAHSVCGHIPPLPFAFPPSLNIIEVTLHPSSR